MIWVLWGFNQKETKSEFDFVRGESNESNIEGL